jgi:hypothetical protein
MEWSAALALVHLIGDALYLHSQTNPRMAGSKDRKQFFN